MNADFILRMNIDELNKLYKKHKTDPIKSKVIMMRIKELENRNKTYRKVKEDTINLTKKKGLNKKLFLELNKLNVICLLVNIQKENTRQIQDK